MPLLIQSAEGVVRKDGGRGGGGECKKLWLKLKNATKWNKDECSTEPQTEYKRQSCEIYMAGRRDEQNAKLQTLPVTHNTGPDPEPVDHPGTLRDHANSDDLSNVVVSWSPRQQETGRHAVERKRLSPIFNKIWCYFSLSVMLLLLQIGLAVKGIDCEPEPQPGLKETEMEGVSCQLQVICIY